MPVSISCQSWDTRVWDSSGTDAFQLEEDLAKTSLNPDILVMNVLKRGERFSLSFLHLLSNLLGCDLFIMIFILLSLHQGAQRSRNSLPFFLFLTFESLIHREKDSFEVSWLFNQCNDLVSLFIEACLGHVLISLHHGVGSLEGLEELSRVESEHDEVVDLLESPNYHDGTVQGSLSGSITLESFLDVFTESWWNLVTLG